MIERLPFKSSPNLSWPIYSAKLRLLFPPSLMTSASLIFKTLLDQISDCFLIARAS